MSQSSGFISSQDHTKPFIVAIGIAFTFLALVVLYIAFSKGGFDIRSRASGGSCRNIVPNPSGSHCSEVNCSSQTSAISCSSKSDSNNIKCCRWYVGSVPTPTFRPTKTPMVTPTYGPTKKPTVTPTKKPTIPITPIITKRRTATNTPRPPTPKPTTTLTCLQKPGQWCAGNCHYYCSGSGTCNSGSVCCAPCPLE